MRSTGTLRVAGRISPLRVRPPATPTRCSIRSSPRPRADSAHALNGDALPGRRGSESDHRVGRAEARARAIDFKTAAAAGLAGLDDQEVLTRSAREGRILVTHDQTTMPRHFGEFVHAQRSPGLLVVPQHLVVRQVAD